MSYLNKKISFFIDNQFPRYIRTEGETLVKFIQYYYEWLESENQPLDEVRRFKDYRSSEITDEKFIEFLRSEFMSNVPSKLLVDERLLMRNISNFYQAKGTEEAYRLLFRILYNEEIDFYYPGSDILRASDGRWIIDKYLKVNSSLTDTQILGISRIVGQNSKAEAKIVNYTEELENNTIVKKLFVDSIFGTFFQNENILDKNDSTVVAYTTSTLISTSGRYSTTKGFLSWDKYLQDNFYYQEFSYVIKTSRSISEYKDTATKLTHPAGTKLFGRITVEKDLELQFTGNEPIVLEFKRGIVGLDELGYLIEFTGHSLTDINNYSASYDLIYEPEGSVEFTDSDSYFIQALTVPVNLSGNVSLRNTAISSYTATPLLEMRNIPLNEIGKQNLICGTGTTFTVDFGGPDSLIRIFDVPNGATGTFFTIAPYSNTFMKITTNYSFSTLTNQNYTKIAL